MSAAPGDRQRGTLPQLHYLSPIELFSCSNIQNVVASDEDLAKLASEVTIQELLGVRELRGGEWTRNDHECSRVNKGATKHRSNALRRESVADKEEGKEVTSAESEAMMSTWRFM